LPISGPERGPMTAAALKALAFARQIDREKAWEALRTTLAVAGGFGAAGLLASGRMAFLLPAGAALVSTWYMIYRLY